MGKLKQIILKSKYAYKILYYIYLLLGINKVKVKGQNNKIIIEDGIELKHTQIVIMGNNNKVIIKNNVRINEGTIICEGDNNTVIIEEGVLIFGKTDIAALEGTTVKIGKNSLFSSNIVIRTSDSHSIINLENDERINKAKDITIGERVWITEGVSILKGAKVANNSVLATKCVVTSQFDEPNVIIAGIPSKIIKRNIDWNVDKI